MLIPRLADVVGVSLDLVAIPFPPSPGIHRGGLPQFCSQFLKGFFNFSSDKFVHRLLQGLRYNIVESLKEIGRFNRNGQQDSPLKQQKALQQQKVAEELFQRILKND